jgi:benzoyl-CoA reductase/2-hydroxyglutaryl-CoA dehydratase subunit BcrC/BadD/HgdB
MLAIPPEDLDATLGITTTVPVEVVFAAGLRPVDLNNVFITSGEAASLVEEAEREGFPRNCCSWTKGCYAAARRLGLKRIVAVTEGDCSMTHALMEVLASRGVQVTPFAFPFGRDRDLLRLHLERFAMNLGAALHEAEAWRRRLAPVRALAHEIDGLCWQERKATPEEAYVWLISTSDFLGAPDLYEREARAFIEQARRRSPAAEARRLAVAGIPPICDGFYAFLESLGARVVYHEVPRQFSMPDGGDSLVEQYARYTYPYDIFGRLDDIVEQCRRRRVDGMIHYVQSFCFRQAQDSLVRRAVGLPVLTLECDRPGPLDGRSRTRIEAFCEMLPAARPGAGG